MKARVLAPASVGFNVGGGLSFLILPNVAVFGEYRFSYAHPEFSSSDVKVNLDTHQLVGGVSFRF